MRIVDVHCHVSPHWYEPIEALLEQMDRSAVEQAILVQFGGQYDNSYQFECITRYPDRLASVVLVDSDQTEAVTTLAQLAEQGAAGVRLRAATRSPGDDPLAIWRAAAALDLPISSGGTSADFASDEFSSLVQSIPDVPIIVEHLGSVNHADGETPPYPLRRKVFDLARFPNVYIKIHGLGEICRRKTPFEHPFPFESEHLAILDLAVESFGPSRMMWGSDYPPVSGREGYHNALVLPMQHLESLSDGEREMIFGGTARQVYSLP